MGPHKTAKSQRKPQVLQPLAAGSVAGDTARNRVVSGSLPNLIHTEEEVLLHAGSSTAKPQSHKGQTTLSFYKRGDFRLSGCSPTSGQLQFGTYRRGHRRRLWPVPDFWRWWPVGSPSGPLTGPLPSQCPGSLQKQHRLCPSWTAESQTRRKKG